LRRQQAGLYAPPLKAYGPPLSTGGRDVALEDRECLRASEDFASEGAILTPEVSIFKENVTKSAF
jgi:hypothetical protein